MRTFVWGKQWLWNFRSNFWSSVASGRHHPGREGGGAHMRADLPVSLHHRTGQRLVHRGPAPGRGAQSGNPWAARRRRAGGRRCRRPRSRRRPRTGRWRRPHSTTGASWACPGASSWTERGQPCHRPSQRRCVGFISPSEHRWTQTHSRAGARQPEFSLGISRLPDPNSASDIRTWPHFYLFQTQRKSTEIPDLMCAGTRVHVINSWPYNAFFTW